MTIKKSFKIKGMHCTSCAMLIEGELEDKGANASCSYAKSTVDVEYDPDKLSEQDIEQAVRVAGYTIV
jgi:P-type Cu+ transporter